MGPIRCVCVGGVGGRYSISGYSRLPRSSPLLVKGAVKGSLQAGLMLPNIMLVATSRPSKNVIVFALIDGSCKVTDIHPDLRSS